MRFRLEESQEGEGEGSIEDDADMEGLQINERLNRVAFLNVMKKQNKRFCDHCQMFKVLRIKKGFIYINI